MTVRIRAAESADIELLNALTYRSKAHWQYDEAFMQVAQQIMRLTPMSVLVQPIFVAESDGQIAGFYALRSWQDEPAVERAIELDLFFVDVPFIGTGVGRVLFDHAVQVSTAMGYHTMVIISDPNAEGFYAKMGASTFARHQSEIVENRFLPVMQLALK